MKTELRKIAKENNFEIVYACESGSRVWGFESPDSDYDIRFIYVQPWQNYVTISKDVDDTFQTTIDNLDISGWDIKKTMQLFLATNPSLFEWLRSPIVYIEPNVVIQRLQKWAKEYYNPLANAGHYYSIAIGHYNKYIDGKDVVGVKKYLYAIRASMCLNWIKEHYIAPPLDIEELVHSCPTIEEDVMDLVDIKRRTSEDMPTLANQHLNEFIYNELTTMPHFVDFKRMPLDKVDTLFRTAVMPRST